MRLLAVAAVFLAGSLVLAGCGGSSSSSKKNGSSTVSLVGGGSTFDQPFFTKAFSVYSKSHKVSVNYQAIGSGAGIQQFTAKTVDFGASDVPMNSTELSAAQKSGTVVQIPIALGGVSIAYNIPGLKSGLHLTGPVIANIYLGTIKSWNDPAIVSLNPGKKLPNLHITVAHRSDSSGTSYIFTSFLSSVSPAWKSKVGANKLPNWPAGAGAKGNSGVAGIVQQTPGAIGYVELAYVIQSKMTDAAVQNSSHMFVMPTQSSISAAASQFPNVSAINFSIVNAKGSSSYPIVGYSWVLLYQKYSSSAKGKALADLMKWTATTGQSYAKALDYVPLPKVAQNLAVNKVNTVK